MLVQQNRSIYVWPRGRRGRKQEWKRNRSVRGQARFSGKSHFYFMWLVSAKKDFLSISWWLHYLYTVNAHSWQSWLYCQVKTETGRSQHSAIYNTTQDLQYADLQDNVYYLFTLFSVPQHAQMRWILRELTHNQTRALPLKEKKNKNNTNARYLCSSSITVL